jgi:RimJ/RimL family protein N-acetyltransferase
VGEGPSLTTPRLTAVPLTMWNVGLVADEMAGQLGHPDATAPGRPRMEALRRDLRRRSSAGPEVLTWVIRAGESGAVGLLSADTADRRAVVTVSIGHPHRRRGYATEALRAVAGWIESGRAAVVEARVRVGDVPSERLVLATAFQPTDVLLAERWRIWLRPPS